MNNGARAHLLHNKVHSTFLRGELYCGKEPGGPLRNCVAENKEKGSAEGEICEVKAALGGLMVCRPLRPFPLLGQGLGRGDLDRLKPELF